MNFKGIEELSIFYLEGIGFKEGDHVIVLNLDGSILHGSLKFNKTFSTCFPITLETHDKKIIDLYSIIGICHINIEIIQTHLYDIEDNYRVIFKPLNIDSFIVQTPRKIFKELTLLWSYQPCNMNIDSSSKTIKIFPSTIQLKI